jgi:hypothetical protein
MTLEDPAGTPALIDAIKHLHNADAKLLEYVPIREKYKGQVVWEGTVAIFALTGHPSAKRAYAWSYATEGTKRRFVVVLHQAPVDSPLAAVRASLAADKQSGQ